MLRKIGASFLLLLFTGSMLGITVGKMTCLNSGRSVYALGEIQDCCPPDYPENTTVKGHCCAFYTYDFTTDLPYIEYGNFSDVQDDVVAILPSFAAQIAVVKDEVFDYADSSPPDPGRPIYLLNETFLI